MTQETTPPKLTPALARALDTARSGSQTFAESLGRILLVSDDPAMAELAGPLAAAGHTVTLARDSLEALERILVTRDCPFDLVLIEATLSGFSSADICRVIRQRYRRNDLSVILLSGPGDSADAVQALRCGGDDVLSRPFRQEELLVRIGTALDLLYSHRELARQYSQLQTQQNHLIEQEKMAALGLLSAGIAHEIHNPNYYIKVGLDAAGIKLKKFRQFLDDLLEGDDSDDLRIEFDKSVGDITRQLDTAREGSVRISEIVTSMRDISKGDDGEARVIDPLESLESAVRLVKMNYKHDIDFEFRLLERAPIVGRLPQINQVFLNLLINACQAIEDKRAAGSTTRGRIVLHSRVKDKELLIAIEDNGIGMSEETQQKMFTPFFTTKRDHRGTGLGLAICRKILTDHDATLEMQSAENEGTMITLRFFVAPQQGA